MKLGTICLDTLIMYSGPTTMLAQTRDSKYFFGFPGGSAGKESTCNVGDWVQSLDWEDPLEEGTATHSSILAWRMPWTV